VLATKRDYDLILDVVRRIDVVPRQVVLEVTIAEIQLNKDINFGVTWAISQGALNKAFPSGPNTKDAGQGADIFTAKGDDGTGTHQLAGLIAGAARVPAQGAFAVISNRDNFQAFINALATRSNVKMLSTPHIIAADNREAHILVGESVPILTSSQTSTIATANIINSVQYRDTGKILTILPQVNSKGLVNLQIRQEVSAVGQTVFGNTNSPSFSTREAETTAVVQDGEGVLIGGIIDEQVTHTKSGLPFLMDIPVLGHAFRQNSDATTRTELIILITPYVIRNRDEAHDVTEDFAARIEGFRRAREAMHPMTGSHRRHEADPAAPPPDRLDSPAGATP